MSSISQKCVDIMMYHIVYFLQPIISSWSFQTISRKRFLKHRLQEKKSDLNVLHLDSKFDLFIFTFLAVLKLELSVEIVVVRFYITESRVNCNVKMKLHRVRQTTCARYIATVWSLIQVQNKLLLLFSPEQIWEIYFPLCKTPGT